MTYLYFKPILVADAIRRIGSAGVYFHLTHRAKDPETIAVLVSYAVCEVNAILNEKLRQTATNLFLDYVKIESNPDLAVFIYALEKKKSGSARPLLRLFESRFCREPCGIATFSLILESKKDVRGRFMVDKDMFDLYSTPKQYSYAYQQNSVNQQLQSLGEDLERLRVNLSPSVTRLEIKYRLK